MGSEMRKLAKTYTSVGPNSRYIVATEGDQVVNGSKEYTESLTASEKLVIPLNEPASLSNGCIWIA